MGNFESVLNNFELDCLEEKKLTLKIMSYNVEWGFINLPKNINTDSCGHKIPLTAKAQYNHLDLCAKNIGLIDPDICFLQEIGSLEVMEYLNKKIYELFNINYIYSYSNKSEKGNQGVGVLIKNDLNLNYELALIPNFDSNKALGMIFNYNDYQYKIVGVHLKSFFDQKIKIDTKEQIKQIDTIYNWINKNKNTKSIICGDFNNIPTSEPILHVINDYGYTDWIDSDKYVSNITNNKYTEFYLKKESNDEFTTSQIIKSRIDYILSKNIDCRSIHIVNLQRENISNNKLGLRDENSDHLPVVAIINL